MKSGTKGVFSKKFGTKYLRFYFGCKDPKIPPVKTFNPSKISRKFVGRSGLSEICGFPIQDHLPPAYPKHFIINIKPSDSKIITKNCCLTITQPCIFNDSDGIFQSPIDLNKKNYIFNVVKKLNPKYFKGAVSKKYPYVKRFYLYKDKKEKNDIIVISPEEMIVSNYPGVICIVNGNLLSIRKEYLKNLLKNPLNTEKTKKYAIDLYYDILNLKKKVKF